MKNLLIYLIIIFGASSVFGQEKQINPCATDEKTAEYANMPEYQQNLLESQIAADNDVAVNVPKGTIYKIPVVFHILHDGGVNNVSREQILDALRILNEDYRLQNPDYDQVASVFIGMQADVEIEFVLSSKAPDGTCFTGITRTFNPVVSNDGSLNQVQAVRDGNDIYQGDWPGNKYLNIFVVGSISAPGSNLITLGYTTYPQWGGLTMSNGFHVIHDALGSIGTAGGFDESTSTHEIGHWLNLPHVWGSNNNPGNASSCTTDDGIDDTPRCIGIQGGSCSPTNPNPLNSCDQDNAYWGFDIQDQVENYMDYAHCTRMFSEGQKFEIRTALESSVGGRNNLWSAQNLIDTGADGNLYLCKSDFTADKTTVCAGEDVTFTDASFNVVNGWSWTFTGGAPSSSTSQNPTVTYNTPGIYEVILTSTDGSANDTELKTSYIRVLPIGTTLPFFEGFESYTNLININEWETKNDDGNGFEIATTGLNSSKSARLMNYNENEGTFDELISAPLNLSTVNSPMTLSFRYAYKRRNSNDDDWLKVLVTNTCGQSWAIRKTIHGQILSPSISTSSFVPSSEADWTTIHMTNITSSYWVDNFRYKFQFEAGGGNNMYIDNINIYDGTPSDQIVGITENDIINNLHLFPNPAEEELNLQFSIETAQPVSVQIQNISGQILQNHLVNANAGSNLIFMNTSELSSGIYFMRIEVGETQKTIQFIVK